MNLRIETLEYKNTAGMLGFLYFVFGLILAFIISMPVKAYPNTFPESPKGPSWSMHMPVTAYNSLTGQTDSTPCITASGYDLCAANAENVVATNILPFGTRIRIPEYFGERDFYVVDRMNARYRYKVDIWMSQYQDAREFGSKYTRIEVYE